MTRFSTARQFLFLLLVAVAVVTTTALSAAAAPSKIAVLGATGNLGQQTLRECLARSIPVRCLVRNPSNLPEDLRASPLVEVVSGELLSEASRHDGVFRDDLVAPSQSLLECLEGCRSVVSCYGATRKTKISDLFRNDEDTDPIHAKQINYRSMIALVAACKQVNGNQAAGSRIRHIVRITGKGEDPTGFFSVLLNGLGAFCKAWNYQGEVVLRTLLGGNDEDEDSIGYTIIRPGVMGASVNDDQKKDEEGTPSIRNDDLLLVDQGGNDLKVTKVAYSQIANLMVELVLSAVDGRIGSKTQNKKVTLAAMNPAKDDPQQTKPLAEKIAALRNDSRKYPDSLVAEHKAAVKAFFIKLSVVVSTFGIALVSLASKIFF